MLKRARESVAGSLVVLVACSVGACTAGSGGAGGGDGPPDGGSGSLGSSGGGSSGVGVSTGGGSGGGGAGSTSADASDNSDHDGSVSFVAGPYNPLIPASPTDPSQIHDICVTQVGIEGAGQSTGTICGFNPNFNDEWSGGVPNTCLGIKACTSTLGDVTYSAPLAVTFQVTSGFPIPLAAQILNCQPSANVNHAAGCKGSNDSTSIPTSHQLIWDAPNGNAGPSTTLTVSQIATSDTTSLDGVMPQDWPGSDVLIYDAYGNAVIFAIGVTGCSVNPPTAPDNCE